jgi:hypothetical protein
VKELESKSSILLLSLNTNTMYMHYQVDLPFQSVNTARVLCPGWIACVLPSLTLSPLLTLASLSKERRLYLLVWYGISSVAYHIGILSQRTRER